MKYWQRAKIKSWFYEWLEWYLLHEWDETDNYLIAMDILELWVLRFTIDNIEILAGNNPNSNDTNKNDIR